jgi:hypothetical protein
VARTLSPEKWVVSDNLVVAEITVLLADDNLIVREGARALLSIE